MEQTVCSLFEAGAQPYQRALPRAGVRGPAREQGAVFGHNGDFEVAFGEAVALHGQRDVCETALETVGAGVVRAVFRTGCEGEDQNAEDEESDCGDGGSEMDVWVH